MSAPFPKCLFLACCLLLGAAPSAFAGTVQLSGSTLTYSAAAGEANRVTITAGASSISVNEVGPGVTAGTGCSSTGPSSASCQADGVTAISVSTGDGNDTARVNGWLPATFYDGPGNDTMTGGSGQDTFVSGTGADVLKGGIGYDTADYSARTAPLTVSLDGVANDGEAGEGDNVQTDVEVVTGGAGGDTLDGGLGADDLYGGAGNEPPTTPRAGRTWPCASTISRTTARRARATTSTRTWRTSPAAPATTASWAAPAPTISSAGRATT